MKLAHITSECPQLAELSKDLSKTLKGNNKIDIHDIVKRIKKALDK